MKIKLQLTILAFAMSMFAAPAVLAVPWCHGGTVVTVADEHWSGSELTEYLMDVDVPPELSNGDHNIATAAGYDKCEGYAGTYGPGWVPNAGEVKFYPDGPSSYINSFWGYDLEDGLDFECQKCYPYPPVRPQK